MLTYTRYSLLAAVSVGSFAVSGVAMAQQSVEASGGLSEIVVTARKQQESLLQVPVAVTAVGGETLERAGVANIQNISRVAPQVIVAQGDSGAGASFSIRGLGSPFNDAGVEQSVTVNVDGVSFTRGQFVRLGLFDVAQVEVLKGPQTLFFGKNSPAGVISVRTNGATDTLEGYVRTGYEFRAREFYGEAAVSGPLSDTLSARLALRGSTMRGWLNNVSRPLSPAENPLYPVTGSPGAGDRHAPGSKEIMGRATLAWEPTSNFDAELKISAGKYKDEGSTTQAYCFDAIGPTDRGLADPFNSCKFDKNMTTTGIDPSLIVDWPIMHRNGKPFSDQWAITGGLTMNYHTDDLTFTSVTGYLKMKYRQMGDYSFTSYGGIGVALGEDYESWSQELRLASDFDGPLNFVLGGFFEDTKRTNSVNSLLFYVGPDNIPGSNTGKYHTFELGHDVKGSTISGFGQLKWEIIENLELAGGVRYTKEKRRQLTQHFFTNPIAGPLLGLVDYRDPNNGSRFRFRDSHWSPEVTLSYKVSPDLMVYGAFKTGYKSGGFSAPSLYQYFPDPTSATGVRTPVTADYAFDPETSKGFEMGVKGKALNNRVHFSLTAYRYKYSNLQTTAFNPSTFSFFIRNAGEAKIQGLELETEWQVIPELKLNFAASYNDAKFTSFETAQCWPGQPFSATPTKGFCFEDPLTGGRYTDLTDEPLSRAPKYTLNGGFDFQTPVSDNLIFGLNGDVAWRDKYVTQEDHHPRAVQRSFAILNAGARIGTEDGKYEFALLGRNLTNKYYVELSSSKAFGKENETGDLQAATPRTREIAIQATVRF